MGKISPKDNESRTPKPRRRLRSSTNKYLKPGALAQLRYTKASGSKSLADIGKNHAGFLGVLKSDHASSYYSPVLCKETEVNPSMMSPERYIMTPQAGSVDLLKQISPLHTPRTPKMVAEVCESDSRLEALPMDILVKVLCHLHHDQLRPVFHVSQRIRKAVMIAQQLHFNFTTPDRSRQEMLRTISPLAAERWPVASKGDRKGFNMSKPPHTPKAPRHGLRPPSRLKCTDMKQIAAVLFQEPSFPTRCLVPSVLSKPHCKNRALFYEDELCQAVAQNKLR